MTIELQLPQLSMTMQEGKVVEWLVDVGDAISEGQAVVSVEADKGVTDVESPDSGVLSQIFVPAGREVKVGCILAVITKADQSTLAQSRASSTNRISPAARKLAREYGIDVAQIARFGSGRTIVAQDVERYVNARQSKSVTPPTDKRTDSIPLDGLRAVMARRMTASHSSIVQATTVADVDMSRAVSLRKKIAAGYTAFVINAAAGAVSDFPLINATFQNDRIAIGSHVHMGVAVDSEAGLYVPVIRHAESKSLLEIQQELERLVNRARRHELTVEEQAGPTMTVSNSGALGSLLFTPIVVLPQSATLGMGRVVDTPVVREGQVVIGSIMYLCLSYDHRFIDGGIAVRYLQRVKSLLEEIEV